MRTLLALLAGIVFTATSLLAQGAKVSSPAELARLADQLKPGEWVWAPDVAPEGPVLIYVDLSRQLATVYRNGVRIGVTTISSGKEGHETPTGVFTILQKDADHHSNIYNNAPMYYQERLTWGGVALHAGGLPGYPESHGCIHLPYTFSQELFKITHLGITVVVQGNAASHITDTSAGLLAPMNAQGVAVTEEPLTNEQFRWQPDLSPTGPLTIIISKSDQRIVVLRNGIEIGRSLVQIDETDTGSHVITYSVGKDGVPHWIYVGLPGHADDSGRLLDANTLSRVHMPRTFYEDLHAAITPGTTILVTQSSVGTDTTGQKLTIIDAVSPTMPATPAKPTT